MYECQAFRQKTPDHLPGPFKNGGWKWAGDETKEKWSCVAHTSNHSCTGKHFRCLFCRLSLVPCHHGTRALVSVRQAPAHGHLHPAVMSLQCCVHVLPCAALAMGARSVTVIEVSRAEEDTATKVYKCLVWFNVPCSPFIKVHSCHAWRGSNTYCSIALIISLSVL